jgi:phosphotransferase system HPr (HPr) family protein
MIERDLEVTNRKGLHARAAAKLVNLASRFESDVHLIANGEEVEGKSILGILMLGAAQGTQLTLRCHGNDETTASEAIAGLFEGRFEESD